MVGNFHILHSESGKRFILCVFFTQQEAFDAFDKDWAAGERREKRVGNWRDFQSDPEAKRVKASSFKEEARGTGGHKFGQVKVETWKKTWK